MLLPLLFFVLFDNGMGSDRGGGWGCGISGDMDGGLGGGIGGGMEWWYGNASMGGGVGVSGGMGFVVWVHRCGVMGVV